MLFIYTLSLPPSFSAQYDPLSVGHNDLDPFGYVYVYVNLVDIIC